MNQIKRAVNFLGVSRLVVIAVSYTHLDVYKRQSVYPLLPAHKWQYPIFT